MSVSVIRGSIFADALGGHVRRSRTFVPRRICAEVGCATLLSIYNPRPHCAIHGV